MEKVIQQWRDIAKNYQGGAILLGNGASIAIDKAFRYKSLYETLENKLAHSSENECLKKALKLFKAYKTDDFEYILRKLSQAQITNDALEIDDPNDLLKSTYANIRKSLIDLIAEIHPKQDIVSPHFELMTDFLMHFKTVLSLNYDLTLYWAQMKHKNTNREHEFKDCFSRYKELQKDIPKLRRHFRKGTEDGVTLIFYPHGNIFLYTTEKNSKTRKETAGEYSSILNEYCQNIDHIPVFVSEGTSEEKKKAILENDYTRRIFQEILPKLDTEKLTIYGWRVADQDNHILEALKENKLTHIAISIHNPNDQNNRNRIETLINEYFPKAHLDFFKADSHGCWIHPKQEVIQTIEIEKTVPPIQIDDLEYWASYHESMLLDEAEERRTDAKHH
jgi:hypothetical protein